MVNKSAVAALLVGLSSVALLVGVGRGWSWKEPFEIHGHRGALGDLPPGNTIVSFEAAIRQGATTLEADLRLTQDGQVVLSHDAHLAPECHHGAENAPPARSVAKLPLATIKHFDCHPRIPGRQAPPTLSELLHLSRKHDVALNIELKPRGLKIARAVARQVTDSNEKCGGCWNKRLTIQSFRPEHLEEVAHLTKKSRFRPRLSFLSDGTELAELLAMKSYVDVYSPNAAKARLDGALVERLDNEGIAVIPWTVNDPKNMCQFAAFGVDGLITDYPSRAVPIAEHARRGTLSTICGTTKP